MDIVFVSLHTDVAAYRNSPSPPIKRAMGYDEIYDNGAGEKFVSNVNHFVEAAHDIPAINPTSINQNVAT